MELLKKGTREKGDVRAEVALHSPRRIFHETFSAVEESGRVIQEVVTPK
jgi:hypothetical protein